MHDPRQKLALAERHVLEAEERLAAHRRRIRRWRRIDGVTQEAATLLRLMEDSLVLMLRHQDQLRAETAKWRSLYPDRSAWADRS
jgi:hypothetical protein